MRGDRIDSLAGRSQARTAGQAGGQTERALRLLNENASSMVETGPAAGGQHAKRWCLAISTRRIGTDPVENRIAGWRLTR